MDFLFSLSLVLCHLSSFISYLNYFPNLLGFEKLVQDYLNFAAVRLFVPNMLKLTIIRKVEK